MRHMELSKPDERVQRTSLTNDLGHSAFTVGAFGIFAGVAALQFFSEVPKVRKDIMEVRKLLQASARSEWPQRIGSFQKK